eukprot:6123960-Pyramimonas_sp.AAC.1
MCIRDRFEARLAALPEAPAAAAYQVRRGAASHAAAVDLLPLSAVTERLQRASARSSLRYAEHVRYLAMLKQAPQVVVDWSELIHVLLGCLLLGADVLEAPAFLPRGVLATLRDSCAGGPASGASKRVKSSSKLGSRRVK